VWYRPAHAPQGLVLQIPEETYLACGAGLTMRRLLAAAGVGAGEVAAWSLQGATYDAHGGANPLLDQPVPRLPPNDEGGSLDGLHVVQKEFETYRKTVQNLLTSMQTAQSNAARDGEQRATQLLTRIAAKVRTARTKR